MIIVFNETENPLLAELVNEIHEESMEQCELYREFHETIFISTWDEAKERMGGHKNNGFGFGISNHPFQGEYHRFVIINWQKCTQADLNRREIKAVIMHELGHLLNAHEKQLEPNTWHCIRNGIEFNDELYQEIKVSNALNNELYADSYAVKFGYGDTLISSFEKHRITSEDVGFAEERIEKINNNELLIGTVKEIVPFS